ncbi:MAG TPA: DUF998 domain-containing protein [Vicinamibacteria bacterium]|nr:DUF998 domain-containing protein [Vicinamibacteria bacterium]
MDEKTSSKELVSYLTLRKVVGVLGVLLPLLCLGFGLYHSLEDSISDYYGTSVRDLFVGILFAIAWFMFTYKGYERKDDLAGDLACFFALGVALFPTTSARLWIRTVHFVCAAALLLVLSYFSLRLFTKTGGSPTPQKLQRNKVYRVCGWIMLACIGSILFYYLFLEESALAALKPVFWLESFALWAFGVSWTIKGEMLLQDKP